MFGSCACSKSCGLAYKNTENEISDARNNDPRREAWEEVCVGLKQDSELWKLAEAGTGASLEEDRDPSASRTKEDGEINSHLALSKIGGQKIAFADGAANPFAGHDESRDAPEITFSWWLKARIPMASFAQAFALASIVFVPNVYISLFKGDAKLIGLANILVVPFDIVINPLFGRLSDAGFFNRGCFQDVDSWGRRSPVFLAALPACVVSAFLSWVGAENLQSALAVALWYAAMRFLLTAGTAMFETAFQSGFTELFPSMTERVHLGVAKFISGLVGGGLGAAGIGATALGVKDPGSVKQRLTFLCFGVLTATIWLLAVPYALMLRRSLMKKVVVGQPYLWNDMRELWSSSTPFRFFAVATHLYSSAFVLTLTGLPFYFEVALNFSAEQVEQAMRLVLIGCGIVIPFSIPIVNYASKRIDPSRLAAMGGFSCVIISMCHGHASFGLNDFWPQVVQIAIVCGAGVGLLSVSWASAQSAMFTWIVDDDQVRQAERGEILEKAEIQIKEIPARRDGLINSFKTCFSLSGMAWAGVFQVLLGIFGYDGERYSNGERQPEEVRVMMDLMFIAIVPSMFILFAISMLFFPLRGERLQILTTKYAKLYNKLASEAKTKTSVMHPEETRHASSPHDTSTQNIEILAA